MVVAVVINLLALNEWTDALELIHLINPFLEQLLSREALVNKRPVFIQVRITKERGKCGESLRLAVQIFPSSVSTHASFPLLHSYSVVIIFQLRKKKVTGRKKALGTALCLTIVSYENHAEQETIEPNRFVTIYSMLGNEMKRMHPLFSQLCLDSES